MKRKSLRNTVVILLLVCGMTVGYTACHNNTSQSVQQAVASGAIESYPDFASQYITPRNVTVWTPDGYTVGDSCAVIYMHDGQMLFDATTTWNKQEWKVDEVVGQLIADGTIYRCIVVGIDNTDNRLNEYFPSETLRYTTDEISDYGEMSPQGDAYLAFIVEELKPFIDDHYKPLTDRRNTYVMGSSMGGLISLYALCQYPHIFGGAACLSTHLSFGHLSLDNNNHEWAIAFKHYLSDRLSAIDDCMLYMDRGTEGIDTPYAPYQAQVDTLMSSLGWDGRYMSKTFEGHEHSETCWAERLHEPLTFLLGQ